MTTRRPSPQWCRCMDCGRKVLCPNGYRRIRCEPCRKVARRRVAVPGRSSASARSSMLRWEAENGRPWSSRYPEVRRRAEATRRGRKYGGEITERFGRREIGERDGWMCGICGEPVDPALPYPELMSQSLDHVIPLSRGGTHTRGNCQIAHLCCNIDKSDRLG